MPNPLFNLSLFTQAKDMPLFSRPLAGPGYIILNVLRVMNIISLLLVAAASAVMLVKTIIISNVSQIPRERQSVHTDDHKFFFFNALNHLIVLAVSLFLIVSELSLFQSYFYRNWPLLSTTSSLITLGCAMIVVGVALLGNLNNKATSQDSLGLPFWQLVVAAGIIVCVMGGFNLIANFVFSDRHTPVTARQVRCDGATASKKSSPAPSLGSNASPRRSFHRSFSSPLAAFRSNRNDTLPTQQPKLQRQIPISISRPMNTNPQFQDWVSPVAPVQSPQRPDDAHHPAHVAVHDGLYAK
ncbi:MAG: hypothetical protein M4579_005269 [Chaenotheca gracillima]|nr:MAG: hypothetical protein M4579_005269 [Chaenotheca gracillima]